MSAPQFSIDVTSPHLLAAPNSGIMAGNEALVWIDCEVSFIETSRLHILAMNNIDV